LQRQWLIRKYVNQTNPAPLRPLPGGPTSQTPPAKGFQSPKSSGR